LAISLPRHCEEERQPAPTFGEAILQNDYGKRIRIAPTN